MRKESIVDIQAFYKQVRVLTNTYVAENFDWEWTGTPKEFTEQFISVMRGALVELNFRVTTITALGSISTEFMFARFEPMEITLGTGTVLNLSRCTKITLMRTGQWWLDLYLEADGVKVLITIPLTQSTEYLLGDIIK
jgi:hypothetical protein